MDLVLGGRDPGVPLGARLAILAVACAGQCFRHRAPAVALVVAASATAVDLALGPSLPTIAVLIDVLFAAALHGSRRLHQVIAGAVAALTVGVTAVVAVVGDWRLSFHAGLQVFSLLVVPVWWAANVRRHREGAEQVARIAELDRRAAVGAERNRMARDLHDVVAGHLSAIAIQAEAALSLEDEAMTRTVLKAVRENSVSALDEMRAMINLLRADVADPDEPTAPARLAQLPRLIDSAQAGGMKLDVRVDYDDSEPLPAAVDLTAYRIAQEALTNA
ncbi:two-component sensor histidine kinase, partial [Saccharothrix sp. MB29]|nr:two-component sensor histidine kinase [Saccharothrix sp. MB29]